MVGSARVIIFDIMAQVHYKTKIVRYKTNTVRCTNVLMRIIDLPIIY